MKKINLIIITTLCLVLTGCLHPQPRPVVRTVTKTVDNSEELYQARSIQNRIRKHSRDIEDAAEVMRAIDKDRSARSLEDAAEIMRAIEICMSSVSSRSSISVKCISRNLLL